LTTNDVAKDTILLRLWRKQRNRERWRVWIRSETGRVNMGGQNGNPPCCLNGHVVVVCIIKSESTVVSSNWKMLCHEWRRFCFYFKTQAHGFVWFCFVFMIFNNLVFVMCVCVCASATHNKHNTRMDFNLSYPYWKLAWRWWMDVMYVWKGDRHFVQQIF
jgi:hypothetical protein